MKPGSKICLFILTYFISFSLFAEEKITTSPLLNVDKIKPSFEEFNDEKENITSNKIFKRKKI